MNSIVIGHKALEKIITDGAAPYNGNTARYFGNFNRKFTEELQKNGLVSMMSIPANGYDFNAPVVEARFLPYFTGVGDRENLDAAEVAACGRQQVLWRAFQDKLQKCVSILGECITPQLKVKLSKYLQNQPGQPVLDGRALAQRTLVHLKTLDKQKRHVALGEINLAIDNLPKQLLDPSTIRLWIVVYDMLILELSELQFDNPLTVSENTKVLKLISCLHVIGFQYNIQKIQDSYDADYDGACAYLTTLLSKSVPIAAVPTAMVNPPILPGEVAINYYYAAAEEEVNYTSIGPRCINCSEHSAMTICNKPWCCFCGGDWSQGQAGYHNFQNCWNRPGAIAATTNNRIIPYNGVSRAPAAAVRGARSGGRAPFGRAIVQPGRGSSQPGRGAGQYGRGGVQPARGVPQFGRGRGFSPVAGRGYASINAMELDNSATTNESNVDPLVDDTTEALQLQEDAYNAEYDANFLQFQVNSHAIEQVEEQLLSQW